MRSDGPDARMLGDVIAHTFGMRGQEYTEAEWDSWKGEDGKWVVALSWRAGRSDNRAHWTFHPGAHGGTVTALDEHASDLVEGLPARPLRTVGPVIDIARQEEPEPQGPPAELRAAASDNAVRSAAGMRVDAGRDRQPAGRTGAEQRAGTPPTQRQGEPRTEARTDARAVETRAADTGAAENRTAENRAAENGTAEARTVASRPAEPAPSERSGSSGPPAEPAPVIETPDPPAAESPATEPAGNRRTKKGKPVMPSWDEVLLGVRGQR